MQSLQRETNLQRAERTLQQSLTRLAASLGEGSRDVRLLSYAAQASYSYAFAFCEDKSPELALQYYFKAHVWGRRALAQWGLVDEIMLGDVSLLAQRLDKLPDDALAALYWTALSWARLIELRQPDVLMLTQLPRAALLMQQVMMRDPDFQLSGPRLFFAIYHSMRATYLGGGVDKAESLFREADEANQGRLLLVGFLKAQYLLHQQGQLTAYHAVLNDLAHAPEGLYPEQALMNAVVRQRANRILRDN